MCMSGAMENGFLTLDGEEGGYIYANHVLQPKEYQEYIPIKSFVDIKGQETSTIPGITLMRDHINSRQTR